MNRWLRILRHRWLDETDARRALGPGALERIEARVAESERRHRGEIRVCVEAGLPLSYLWRNADVRERAVAMFGKLRVWDTEENNGVLVYLLLAEHRIELVADRGLARHADDERWRALVDDMSGHFRARRFEQGLNLAIERVDHLLTQHFPARPGEPNPDELPNTPVIG